jgi:hypothetical protein
MYHDKNISRTDYAKKLTHLNNRTLQMGILKDIIYKQRKLSQNKGPNGRKNY